MGYQQDLSDRDLKNLFLRHSDSYTVAELDGEVYLVSTFISSALQKGNLTGVFDRTEIVALIELKRKLLETSGRLTNLKFQQAATTRQIELRERVINSLTPEDAQNMIERFTEITMALPAESKTLAISELKKLVTELNL